MAFCLSHGNDTDVITGFRMGNSNKRAIRKHNRRKLRFVVWKSCVRKCLRMTSKNSPGTGKVQPVFFQVGEPFSGSTVIFIRKI